MKVKIVLLALLVVICLAVVAFTGSRQPLPDKDKQANYQPTFPFDWLGKAALLWPGATYKLVAEPVSASPGSPLRFSIGAASGRRVLRLALLSGLVARVTYTCNGGSCSTKTCLVKKGFTPPASAGCSDPDRRDSLGFSLERDGGTLLIEAVSNQPVTIESR